MYKFYSRAISYSNQYHLYWLFSFDCIRVHATIWSLRDWCTQLTSLDWLTRKKWHGLYYLKKKKKTKILKNWHEFRVQNYFTRLSYVSHCFHSFYLSSFIFFLVLLLLLILHKATALNTILIVFRYYHFSLSSSDALFSIFFPNRLIFSVIFFQIYETSKEWRP